MATGYELSSATWINCTDPESKCESIDWAFGGVAGTCNATTSVCSCGNIDGSGYSGLDDFDAYNDCHVAHRVRDVCRTLAYVCTLLSLIISIALTIKLLFKWGIIYIPADDGGSSFVDSKEGANFQQQQQQTPDTENKYHHYKSSSITTLAIGPTNPPDPMAASPPPGSESAAMVVSTQVVTTAPKQSFEPNAKLIENVEDEGAEDPLPFVSERNSLPIIDESEDHLRHSPGRKRQTASQKFGFMVSPGTNGADQEPGTSNESSSEASRNMRGSSLAHTTGNTSTAKEKKGHSEGFFPEFPKKMPRASVKVIKQLLPSREPRLGPKSAMMDELKRKRRTFILIILCLGFSLFMSVYLILIMFAGMSHRENDAAVNAILMLLFDCVFFGLWILAYTWYDSLPNLSTYGKLFKIDSILIRYPKLAPRLTIANIAFVSLTNLLFVFVFPIIFPESRHHLDTMLMIFGTIELAVFMMTFASICYLLSNCFTSMLNNPLLQRKESAEGTIIRARNTVRIGAALGIVGCTLCGGLFLLLALVPVVRTNLWIITPGLIVVGCAVEIVIMYIAVIRTGGTK